MLEFSSTVLPASSPYHAINNAVDVQTAEKHLFNEVFMQTIYVIENSFLVSCVTNEYNIINCPL